MGWPKAGLLCVRTNLALIQKGETPAVGEVARQNGHTSLDEHLTAMLEGLPPSANGA